MNGEPPTNPQVPVTTLPGIASLTELLPELPLPSNCENEKSRSLLFHPRVAEEAQRHLSCQTPELVSQLASALASTSADHIELKQQYSGTELEIDIKNAPPLLQGKTVKSEEGNNFLVNHAVSPVNLINQKAIKEENNDKHMNHLSADSLGGVHGNQPFVVLNKLPDERLNQKSNCGNATRSSPTNVAEQKTSGNLCLGNPVVRLSKLANNSLQETLSQPKDAKKKESSRRGRESRKYVEISSESEGEEEDKKRPAKYFKSRDKEREEKKRRDKADRKRGRTISDDEYNPDLETKKRKTGNEDSESEVEVEQGKKSQIAAHSPPKRAEYNRKKAERILAPQSEKLGAEEMMESGVYRRFNRCIEKIFDNTEDLDINAEIDENGDVPQEYLIPKYELADLCSEAAKLKSLKAMSYIPPERLVRLLNILEKNIRDGAKVTPIVEEEDEEDDKLWVELVMERILRGVDASLTVLYIMTSNNINKRVFLEDVIERCVQFAKFQLSNTIYPSFDPVYRIDGNKEIFLGNMKRKRAKVKDVRNRSILAVYNKLNEVVGLLADLVTIQPLTDTTVLQLSTLGVAPFFVENVSELQLSALKLVTKIFTRYDKHRRLLLDDILASIARLPSSKRSLRTYKLSSDECIQMLTALVLQLIQCVVELPDDLHKTATGEKVISNEPNEKVVKSGDDKKDTKGVIIDKDVLVCNKYDNAMGTAYSFLAVFLQKTGSKNEEIDYRPLFENFVQDLLLTVNRPEWPASELLLSLLGQLLVQKFTEKSTDLMLRVSSLDCLGVVAAKLRRDAVTSHLKVNTIDEIIRVIKEEENKDAPYQEDVSHEKKEEEVTPRKKNKKKGKSLSNDCSSSEPPLDVEEERTIFLQRVLLDWLAVNSESDKALLHARHFYVGQWYRYAYKEILQQKQGPVILKPRTKKSMSHNKRKRRKGESEDEESDPESEEDATEQPDEALQTECRMLAVKRKNFLISKVPAFPPASPGAQMQILQTHIDYENAELITRVLTEQAIGIRTKAMKCLTMIVEADPAVLARTDMQMGVHHSFLDHSTSVREAAVDLIGKFVLSRPELLYKYYDMISARILDTGVSVRKRVIKIMKEICLECPNFSKIPEICVKMIRRVNDEEGIKKLVQEVFQNMWFTPISEKPCVDTAVLIRKVTTITEVVIASNDTGLDWFEQLLYSMFRPKEDKEDVTKVKTEPPKSLVLACKQIVDNLVQHILLLEENNAEKSRNNAVDNNSMKMSSSSLRIIACLRTLYLFAKIRPQLLVNHATTLQPYLSLKCQTVGDYTVIGVVARTLELVIPLMEHPGETFLAQLEEDAVKIIIQHDRSVITSCLALLGSVVNTVTKNYSLVRDCFNKYYSFVVDYKKLHMEKPDDVKLDKCKPYFRRSLYTVGLLLRHFDFNQMEVRCGLPEDITTQVVETLLYFMDFSDMNVRFSTLQSLGSVCVRHYDLFLGERLQKLYHHLLSNLSVDTMLRIQTLQNIELYLQEEESRMIKQDQEWNKVKMQESLKDMCDLQSGMASAVIQVYLKQILECVIAAQLNVRHCALRVIQLVLAQGLVHPVQIVPFLVAMSSDSEEKIAHAADKQLQEIEKKYPGFIGMKAMAGFRLSFHLQTLIQTKDLTRGFRQKEGEAPGALCGFLYSLMRGTKQQRRALAISLLKQFDELANLILPLNSGLPKSNGPQSQQYIDDDDDDDDVNLIYTRLPANLAPMIELMDASKGCLLLLMLKDHLKLVYGINDGKISEYSPSDTSKQFDKSASRKSSSKFNPKSVLQCLKEKENHNALTEEEKKNLVQEYLDFKALMLKIDPDDEDSENGDISRQNHMNNFDPSSRNLRGHHNSDVTVLPGTHDGWKDKPKGELVDSLVDHNEVNECNPPIKSITIKTSKLYSPHKKSPSSAHKKHKKKKKKKRKRRISVSDDDDEESGSDPDWG